jgi:hypothetical protein
LGGADITMIPSQRRVLREDTTEERSARFTIKVVVSIGWIFTYTYRAHLSRSGTEFGSREVNRVKS